MVCNKETNATPPKKLITVPPVLIQVCCIHSQWGSVVVVVEDIPVSRVSDMIGGVVNLISNYLPPPPHPYMVNTAVTTMVEETKTETNCFCGASASHVHAGGGTNMTVDMAPLFQSNHLELAI